jgi:hypothetical protein
MTAFSCSIDFVTDLSNNSHNTNRNNDINMNQSPLRIHSSISSQAEDNDKLCELFLRLITKVTVQRVQWQSHQPLPCLTTNVKTQAKWNNKLTNNSFGRSRTLQHKQKTLTITWIIHLSDCPRTLQHKHKQWQTRLVGNYLTNLLLHCIYVYVCMHMYVCICICMHAYACVYMHRCMCIYVDAYV